MSFPNQNYPPTQFHFLGSSGSSGSRPLWEEQQILELRRQANTQVAMGLQLSRNAKREYGEDILRCMLEQEMNTLPDVTSIDIQTEIEWYMRPYLLDFLVEAHAAFKLPPETLFLTFNIIDRYCSQRVVYRKHYQLVGCTALLIAAKYDALGKSVPRVSELMGMCCNLYDEDMFVQMERHVLMTLDWSIGAPAASTFVEAALSDAPFDAELEYMAIYLCEIAAYQREFVSQRPSDIAKAAIFLSSTILRRRNPLGRQHWSTVNDTVLTNALFAYMDRPSDILSQKYRQPQYSYVSLLVASYVLQRQNAAAADAAAKAAAITPASLQEHISKTHTPRKRPYPYELEAPPSPPITPGTEANKGYPLPPQAIFQAPETPEADLAAIYNTSFAMID